MSSKATRERKKKILRKEVESLRGDMDKEMKQTKADVSQARQGVFRLDCKMAATLRTLIDAGIITEADWERNYKAVLEGKPWKDVSKVKKIEEFNPDSEEKREENKDVCVHNIPLTDMCPECMKNPENQELVDKIQDGVPIQDIHKEDE